ncbi:hypothetical protein MCOR27_003264 [Pyricularia oryzae]|uniref:Mediator of RNA polymerase II transcription subunit 7 n=5 Tax=Pyricularia TaxID=48558 RepID=A0ABQ8NRF8_PYRGI|nr:uncharacterized protein MGG_08341 [Pyricularia oryzae 70-15]KAH8836325.1 hypothetical protein MCOR01_011621 [Pyricularia oryzae]KAI6300504.1 hypothetical protein MCOR33_003778 [Pyricularia grisea]EHA55916.1 hypothetical protein MGG_08341 [Pyricularia oryzae 70-15]KAH9439966.1 hypothetical protein MCOR02_003500 [Pyricularia oryzae]KAI6260825.1 hypothetical protein MCOR19_002922 [Pyricularia oryzae]
MAEEEPAQNRSFPMPPDYFWKDFTPQNIERIQQLRNEYKDATGIDPPPRLPSLPEELWHLQPPAEPADGKWKVFGDTYTLKDELPTLEDQNIQRVIPTPPPPDSAVPAHADRALVMKRLAKSILLNFLELVGAMAVQPAHGEDKVADISALLMNMEHAINEYRPHQTREQLIQTMQERLDRTRAETAALRAAADKARRVLEGLGSIKVPTREELLGDWAVTSEDLAREEEARRRKRQADRWEAMDAAFA